MRHKIRKIKRNWFLTESFSAAAEAKPSRSYIRFEVPA